MAGPDVRAVHKKFRMPGRWKDIKKSNNRPDQGLSSSRDSHSREVCFPHDKGSGEIEIPVDTFFS